MTPVALYVMPDSIYREKLGAENCYGEDRDARRYTGNAPVIAHPPCKHYCKLFYFAKKNAKEKSCARVAVWQIRRNGGVLEHPAYSSLWRKANLPAAGGIDRDDFGGWTLEVLQFDFGHPAYKKTWLYIVGVSPARVRAILPPQKNGRGIYLWTPPRNRVKGAQVKYMTQKDMRQENNFPISQLREKARNFTPPAFADFLIAVAHMCGENKKARGAPNLV